MPSKALTLLGLVLLLSPLVWTVSQRRQRGYPYESRAIHSLKAIANAQHHYRKRSLAPDGRQRYARSLRELVAANLLDPQLGAGEQPGYRFAVLFGSDYAWAARADPHAGLAGGERHFGAGPGPTIYVSSASPVEFDTLGLSSARRLGEEP